MARRGKLLQIFSFNLLLFLIIILFNFAETKKRPPIETDHEFRVDDITEQNARKFELDKCAFYCFFVPLQDDVQIDLHFYKHISCSDIVYGFAEISDNKLKTPTKMDLIPYSYYGNFKLITSLKLISTSPRVLLGMELASEVSFMDLKQTELALNVTRRIVFFTRRYGFNGIFLKLDSSILLTPGFDQFIELLNEEIKNEKKRSGMRKLRIILSISSTWVRYVYRKMPKFDAYFDAFYLFADEISYFNELPFPSVAIPVDPLHNSEYVKLGDSLARNAEHLAATGIPRKKIIIGLSTWARSYFIKNDNSLIPEIENIVYSDEDEISESKLAYQEVCHLFDSNKKLDLHYDNRSETTSLIVNDQWYSFNEPEHSAFIHKLDWISNHEFGGIGLYSIQGDDPYNNCSKGLLPLHQSVAKHFKCRRGTKRGNLEQLGECTRLCFLDLEQSRNTFEFEQLKPGWCSHLVIGQAPANPYVITGPSKGMRLALKNYNDWERNRKPFLIISFAGTEQEWKLATPSTPTRFILIDRIRHLLDENNADGVELNCANGGPDGSNLHYMNDFLRDLRRTLGNKKQILISINPSSFIDLPNYDFESMSRSVDYIIIIGYRYHRPTNSYTGHHSPLFKNSTLLNQPKMTIQGTLEELLFRKVPLKKLIVSLSAEAMSQHFVEDIYGHRSWENRKIGESAAPANMIRTRSHGPGVVSQTQVCTIMKEDTTISHFLNELGVPYLVNNDREFIAFDNSRSIQIKTVWLSLQNIAGIALHGLELDNIAGECPEGEPFSLLRTIAQSQTCYRCDPSEYKRKDKNTTNENQSEISSLELPENSDVLEDINEEDKTISLEKTTNNQTNRCLNYNEFLANFSVFCSLSLDNIDNILPKIPFKYCNVLIIKNMAKLNGEGKTVDNLENTKEKIEKITNLNKNKKINLWGEISCEMTQIQWEKIINDHKRERTVEALNKFMSGNNLSGLLLDCDNFMRPPLRRDFSQFLNELNSELFEKETEEKKNIIDELMDCKPRLALKIQLSHENISEIYEPEQLNKLLKFILLPSGVAISKARARVLNPLYAMGIANQENTDTQNGTVLSLQNSKIQSNKIVMELPSFAILQKKEEENSEPSIVSQKEVCQFMRKPGVQHHIRYDAVTSYWKTNDEWLSGENEETIKYKVQFAMQRRLGGVLLNSLDSDDPEDFCKNGGFGLLHIINKARCGH